MNFSPFFDDIITNALGLKRPFKLEEINNHQSCSEEEFESTGLFFCNFDNCGTKTYISKKYFFDDSTFTVHFTNNELKDKFLVAPLRFFPFTNEELTLRLNARKIPLIKKKLNLKCLESVYSLDNGQAVIKYLNENSSNTLLNLRSLINEEISVYDFSSVELKQGDHLQVHLQDGELIAEVFNSEDINLPEAQKWCENFEKSLLSVLSEFGPFNDLYTQIELAYFYGSESLRKGSSIALRDFLNLSRKIKLQDFVFQKIIWFADSDPVNSSESIKHLASIKANFEDKIEVSSGFYSLIDEQLKAEFICNSEQKNLLDNSEAYKKLSLAVRKTVLWLSNNKLVLTDESAPQNELLMFDAALKEFQFLCDYYAQHHKNSDIRDQFIEALELNFEILFELMEFLREYYHSK